MFLYKHCTKMRIKIKNNSILADSDKRLDEAQSILNKYFNKSSFFVMQECFLIQDFRIISI